MTQLMVLCARGTFSAVEDYIHRNPGAIFETDSDGDTALNYAVHSTDLRVIKLLLDRGIGLGSQRKDKITALMQTIAIGKKEHTAILLEEYQKRNVLDKLKDKNIYGWTPLFYVVTKQDLNLAKELISLGLDLDDKDVDEKTVLDYAGEDLWIDGIIYFTKKRSL